MTSKLHLPSLEELASEKLVHGYGDPFSLPVVQNEWGYVTVTRSVSGLNNATFPPLVCCGRPDLWFSPGYLTTCEVYLNGRLLTSYPEAARAISYQWFPNRVEREVRAGGFHFRTQTYLPWKQSAVAQWLEITNEGREQRAIQIGYNLRAGVSSSPEGQPWNISPQRSETDNTIQFLKEDGCLLFASVKTKAVSVQGIFPMPTRLEQGRILSQDLVLEPGETKRLHYLNVVSAEAAAACETYRTLQKSRENLLPENETAFRRLIEAAFTPGNSEFSGHLPVLESSDPTLRKLYYGGFSGFVFSRRVPPNNALGGSFYTTLTPLFPTTGWLWDDMMTSLTHALLDPVQLREYLNAWLIGRLVERNNCIDFLNGAGPLEGQIQHWYAANQMSYLRCADQYLRVTGDFNWLKHVIEGKPVLEHFVDQATFWKQFDKHGHGLADFGTTINLLEVVGTWTHEVAAFNAGNVYNMRFVATLLDQEGDAARAAELRGEATALAKRINERLYVHGEGVWRAGQPDGTGVVVRHCYDMITVLDTMLEDLSETQKREISQFFWKELHTPLWMHALSPHDADATWHYRADHSWLGAYVAWPAMTAKGLLKIQDPTPVYEWIRGFAKAFNQGPIGQAHVVEHLLPTDAGGARKSPVEPPFGNDWSEHACGSYTDLVLDSIFGVQLGLDGKLSVRSHVNAFDPEARLRNLHFRGASYTIDRNGATRS